MVVGILTAHGEVTLQHGIGEDEFRCPEVVAAVGIALNGAGCWLFFDKRNGRAERLWHSNRLDGCGYFCGAARYLGIVEESVDIQVDTQLTHLTIIIGIKDVLLETLVLPDATLGTLRIFAVLVVVSKEGAIEVTARMAIVFVEGTKTVVLIDHIVQLQLWRPAFPDAL